MAYILGQHNAFKHGPLIVWPHNGSIHIEDSRDNSYRVESVDVMEERLKGLQDIVKNSLARKNKTDNAFYADELTKMKRTIDSYEKVIKMAKDQGVPGTPDKVKEAKRRAPKTVVKPNVVDMDKFKE